MADHPEDPPETSRTKDPTDTVQRDEWTQRTTPSAEKQQRAERDEATAGQVDSEAFRRSGSVPDKSGQAADRAKREGEQAARTRDQALAAEREKAPEKGVNPAKSNAEIERDTAASGQSSGRTPSGATGNPAGQGKH